MAWAAVIAGGAALAGGVLSSNAAKSAAGAQTAAEQQAIAEQQAQFNTTQANEQPFLQTGTAATQQLSTLLGLSTPQDYQGNPQQWSDAWHQQVDPTGQYVSASDPNYSTYLNQTVNTLKNEGVTPSNASDPNFGALTRSFSASDLAADPVYNSGLQFGLNQGIGQINAQNIANGTGYDSGATAKAIAQYANDYGSTKAQQSYNDFTNNQTNLYNKLAGVSGAGQQAATSLGSTGAATAGSIGSDITGLGNAQASGLVGQANAWQGAATGANSAWNNYNNTALLKNLLTNQSAPGGGTYSSNWNDATSNMGLYG